MGQVVVALFFFNDTATTEIYTLSLHDALPILHDSGFHQRGADQVSRLLHLRRRPLRAHPSVSIANDLHPRSEEHTSELQSRQYLVCRLLLEKKKQPLTLLSPPTCSSAASTASS